jgi:hypothetical protein
MHGSTYPPPYLRTTRCTIGISLPFTLYTTISPTCVSAPRFHKNSKSPRWNAGSIDPDSTTTIGDGESATTENPFHSMKAVESTRAKLRSCVASCRGCIFVRPSMVVVDELWDSERVECGYGRLGFRLVPRYVVSVVGISALYVTFPVGMSLQC